MSLLRLGCVKKTYHHIINHPARTHKSLGATTFKGRTVNSPSVIVAHVQCEQLSAVLQSVDLDQR